MFGALMGGLSGSPISGGPATSGSGDARGSTSGSGISSPVVIGGFKSDGSANGPGMPVYTAIGIGVLILAGALWIARGKR